MVYLRLRSAQLAPRRIAARLRQGGHDVPRADVVRRFSRGWDNFQQIYRPLADSWAVYDNSALRHDCWRKARESENANANEGKPTTELCRWSRACLAPCGEGCSEDCAHVRHAALRVGKRQGCGEEAVRLCHRQPPAMQSYIHFVDIFVGINIQAIN
jgi:hypothetical protein